MKNVSKKNRRTMIKEDEGLLRGRTNHVYVLPTKEKPTEEPEVFLANDQPKLSTHPLKKGLDKKIIHDF